ncbi:MAG: aminotransferase class V-fold PLP-dependent enzyme [candidate division WOR-3 bacterium]
MSSKFEKFREYFPITRNYIYFNHASTAPLNTYSSSRAQEYLKYLQEEGEVSWEFLQKISERTREQAAKLLDCKPSEIAFVQNTSIGINLVIESIKWNEGDEIILVGDVFPALRYPIYYNRYGVKVREIQFHELGKYISKSTKIIAIEWVNYFTGEMVDLSTLKELKERYDFFILLDAIQGLGAFPLKPGDFNIDFVVAGASKWLLGPHGVGILYVSEEAFSKLNSGFVGWLSCPWDSFVDFSRLPLPFRDARSFETGTKNYFGLSYLSGNLDLILEIGVSEVAKRIEGFVDYLFDELRDNVLPITPRNRLQRAGIFTFRVLSKSTEEVFKSLTDSNVKVSLRNGYIRVSPHFYNTFEEVELFVKIIRGGLS